MHVVGAVSPPRPRAAPARARPPARAGRRRDEKIPDIPDYASRRLSGGL